jgi:transposase InsO family protein
MLQASRAIDTILVTEAVREFGYRPSGPFDRVFRSEGLRVIRTPVQAPRANAFAERWVGTLRRECLDWILVVNHHQLEAVLREYVTHYIASRSWIRN